MRSALAALAGGVALIATAQASATITLNHGNALFVDTAPLTTTTTSYGGAGSNTTDVFRPEGGATLNHMFESGWSWRINPTDVREFAFSQAGMVEAGSGTPVGTRSWSNLANGAFSAVNTFTLTDGGVAGAASVMQTMMITNLGAAPLSISLFSYLDFDINGSAGTDSATWADQANNIMQITDGPSTGYYQGIGANAFQVTPWSTLRGNLTNAVLNNLNNTGLPFGPADFTGGFQWNLTIAPGATQTVAMIMSINQAIPTPGALALLGVAGLIGRRRRA